MKINKKISSRFGGSSCPKCLFYELGRYQAGQDKKESNRVAYIDGDQAGQRQKT